MRASLNPQTILKNKTREQNNRTTTRKKIAVAAERHISPTQLYGPISNRSTIKKNQTEQHAPPTDKTKEAGQEERITRICMDNPGQTAMGY